MDENLREAAELPEGGETAVPKAAEPEADEPKTKSIRFAPSAYDPRGIEQWLSERAAEGKLLLRGDDFVIGEPRDCRYHLEPAADDDDPDELLREKRARLGLGIRLPDEGRHFLHLARRQDRACALAAPLHG